MGFARPNLAEAAQISSITYEKLWTTLGEIWASLGGDIQLSWTCSTASLGLRGGGSQQHCSVAEAVASGVLLVFS